MSTSNEKYSPAHCCAIFLAHCFTISLGRILQDQYKRSAWSQLPSSVPVGFLASILILVVSDQILIIAVIIIPSQTEEASALRMRAQPPFVQARHQCQPLTELFGNLDHHHCHRRCRHSWRLIRRIRIPGGITTGRTTLSWMIDSIRQSSH